MSSLEDKFCIVGTGGSARETLVCLIDYLKASHESVTNRVIFLEQDSNYSVKSIMGVPVVKQSELEVSKYGVVVAVGDSTLRQKVVEGLPEHTRFTSIIHPSAILSDWVQMGVGCVITAGTVITCNVKIGDHVQLNLHTNISHDCVLGDYFTTAPGVNISGDCRIGNRVYLGTNSCVRQGVHICDDVTVGMGGVVVKEIKAKGTYVGNPVALLKK